MQSPGFKFVSRQQGLSLIELMVSVAMGLFMLLGLTSILVSSQSANRFFSDIGEMQENGRFGADLLAQSIAMSDHWGGAPTGSITATAGIINAVGNCDQAWVANFTEGIRGYEGGANLAAVIANGLPANCVTAAQYLANTDMLVVRYASTQGMATDLTGAAEVNRLYVRAQAGSVGVLFSGSTDLTAAFTPEGGWLIYPFVVELFFVSPCSDVNTGCTDGIPTLSRLTIHKNSAVANQLTIEPLVPGVEELQFEYGQDSDGDDVVDLYENAGAIAAADWADVVNVRFSMLVRTEQADPGFTDTNTYVTTGFMASNAVAAGVPVAAQSFRRKQYSRVILVRNRGM